MRASTDLHPDDLANRDRIAVELHALRKTAGVTTRGLATLLGCTDGNISRMERRRKWRFMTLAGWARALDRRVNLTITGHPVPDDGDLLASIYANQNPTSPMAQDRLVLRSTVHDLVRVRRATMTAEYAASRLGCGATAVFWWEDNNDGTSLMAVQRYARAVDCQVTADLIPVDAPVRAGVSV